MKHYVVYDATGRIIQYGAVPEIMFELQRTGGRQVLEGKGTWETHYVLNEAIVVRPENPATLDGEWLMRLPVPCTIYINDTAYPCSDDSAELTFAYSGQYAVRIEAFPFLDKSFEIIKP